VGHQSSIHSPPDVGLFCSHCWSRTCVRPPRTAPAPNRS